MMLSGTLGRVCPANGRIGDSGLATHLLCWPAAAAALGKFQLSANSGSLTLTTELK
ncbi:MAG: hypothetical protein OIF38_13075 [Cellvibrionaceae bacterium]|nr:hypothetical protein [Cellvibrionaceae bacterium]